MSEWVDQRGVPVEPAPSGSQIWVQTTGDPRWRSFSVRVLRMLVENTDEFPGIDPDVWDAVFNERPSGELAIEVEGDRTEGSV